MKTRNSLAMGIIMFAVIAGADEVDQLIKQGEQAYADKNYQKTVNIFQQVIAQIQSRIGAMIEEFFPEPQKGWSAGEIENNSWSGSSSGESQSFVNSSRTYTRTKDGMELTMQFCNWPAIVEGMKAGMAAYSNPMMAQILKQQDIDFKSEEKDGWQVVSIIDKSSDNTQIMAFSDNMMIQVQTKAGAADAAKGYVGQIDLAGLGKALQ